MTAHAIDGAVRLAKSLRSLLEKGHMGAASDWVEQRIAAIESVLFALMDACEFETAYTLLEPLVEILPGRAELLSKQGVCLMQTGRVDEALQIFEGALKSAPDDFALLVNSGTALYKAERLEEAVARLESALRRKPGDTYASVALSLALLKDGRLSEGWPYWESRLRQPNLKALSECPLPLWTPDSPSSAKVLVRCEQGFGDSVFFARFLPALRRRCAKTVFLCRPELLSLFKGFEGVDEAIPLDGDERATRGCEFRLPLASLPRYFVKSVEAISKYSKPYLKAPPEKLEKWRARVKAAAPAGTRLRVGLCSCGSMENKLGRMRSIPDEELAPLFEAEGVAWFSLNKGNDSGFLSSKGARDFSAELADFSDTAALIEALDAVVSVDTAVAHLAGALKKRTLLALCRESDWRWFVGRSDSPWYPGMTLFRQEFWGDWSEPLEKIAEALKA